MNFFKKLFAPAVPRNSSEATRDYAAELDTINAKIAADPENAANYDTRSGIYFGLGNPQEGIADFDRATSLETDRELKELRMMELKEMIKKFGGGQ